MEPTPKPQNPCRQPAKAYIPIKGVKEGASTSNQL